MELEVLDVGVPNAAAVIDSIGGDLHLVTGRREDAPLADANNEKAAA
jgi:hypothetical protein